MVHSSSSKISYIFALTLLVGLSGARAQRRRSQINGQGPIEFVVVDNGGIDSQGSNTYERVLELHARIEPHHSVTNGRVNFPTAGDVENHFRHVRAPGDERGHLVASRFSGPPTRYNLSPQDPRVNRNAGGESVSVDWYNEECKVSKWLSEGSPPGVNRFVLWKVTMTYHENSNRPSNYRLDTEYYENGLIRSSNLQNIPNPFPGVESRNWQCRACGLWRWRDLYETGLVDQTTRHRRHLNIKDGEWCTLMVPPVDLSKIAPQPKVPNPKEENRGLIWPVAGGALTGLLFAILNLGSP